MENVCLAHPAKSSRSRGAGSRHSRRLLRRLLRPLVNVDGETAADALVNHFGTLRATLTATSDEQYAAVLDKQVVQYLRVIRQSMRWALREQAVGKTLIASTEALREFLRFSHGGDRVEHLRVFYADDSGMLLRETSFERGATDYVIADVGQIIREGLNLGAAQLVIAHNHPSGNPSPSRNDLDITRRIALAANLVGMALHDHLIITDTADFSFREAGLL